MDEGRTFFGTLEPHVELLHVVVDEGDFVVAHQPGTRSARAAFGPGRRPSGR